MSLVRMLCAPAEVLLVLKACLFYVVLPSTPIQDLGGAIAPVFEAYAPKPMQNSSLCRAIDCPGQTG